MTPEEIKKWQVQAKKNLDAMLDKEFDRHSEGELLDRFAGFAMQAMISNYGKDFANLFHSPDSAFGENDEILTLARCSYIMAHCMIGQKIELLCEGRISVD